MTRQPSLGRVAVVAFYNDRDGKPSDMQSNTHCTTKTVMIKKMIPATYVDIDYWLSTMDVPIGFTKKLKVDVTPYNTTDTL